jgi:hypothetical protein
MLLTASGYARRIAAHPLSKTPGLEIFTGSTGALVDYSVFRSFSVPTVVQLFTNGNALYARILSESWSPLVDSSQGQWAGPIDYPPDYIDASPPNGQAD